MFKLMDKKIIAILRQLFLLNWSYVALKNNFLIEHELSLEDVQVTGEISLSELVPDILLLLLEMGLLTG